MSLARRWLVPGLLLGALIRVWALPLAGTEDVGSFKIWSHNAAHDPTTVYGVGGSPPERRLLHWGELETTTDYPPLALDELGLAGRLYRVYSPDFANSLVLNAAVKLPNLCFEVLWLTVLLTWGRRHLGEATAALAALLFWLNPAVILDGAVLGYLDLAMAIPIVLSLVAVQSRRFVLAGVLMACALLTKPQPLCILPLAALMIWIQQGRAPVRPLVRFAAGGFVASAAILAPVVLRGAWANMVQAVGRLATHDMLSGQQANVWWLFTYVLRVYDVWHEWGAWPALEQRLRILAISRAIDLGYPNARVVGGILVLGALGVAWRYRRQFATLSSAMAVTGWMAWAFALFTAQAHENHLFLAVPLVTFAWALDRRYVWLAVVVSAVTALNVYLFGGFGLTLPPVDRMVTGIDASVLLAAANLGAFTWLSFSRRWGPFGEPLTAEIRPT